MLQENDDFKSMVDKMISEKSNLMVDYDQQIEELKNKNAEWESYST